MNTYKYCAEPADISSIGTLKVAVYMTPSQSSKKVIMSKIEVIMSNETRNKYFGSGRFDVSVDHLGNIVIDQCKGGRGVVITKQNKSDVRSRMQKNINAKSVKYVRPGYYVLEDKDKLNFTNGSKNCIMSSGINDVIVDINDQEILYASDSRKAKQLEVAKNGFADAYSMYKNDSITLNAFAELMSVSVPTIRRYIELYDGGCCNKYFIELCNKHATSKIEPTEKQQAKVVEKPKSKKKQVKRNTAESGYSELLASIDSLTKSMNSVEREFEYYKKASEKRVADMSKKYDALLKNYIALKDNLVVANNDKPKRRAFKLPIFRNSARV